MPVVYALTYDKLPTLPSRTTALIPGTDAAPVASSLTAGDTTQLLTKHNRNATGLDALGTAGAGAYAIIRRNAAGSLDLSAGSDLTLNISVGDAILDGIRHRAATTVNLTDNAYNWVWLTQAGTVSVTSDAAETPVPAAPAAICAFLGRVYCTGAAISVIDYSGRLEFRGGTLWRRTGDSGAPGDTPPYYQIYTETLGGRYWWDGTAYTRIDAPGFARTFLLMGA